jgi:hypothetical protein
LVDFPEPIFPSKLIIIGNFGVEEDNEDDKDGKDGKDGKDDIFEDDGVFSVEDNDILYYNIVNILFSILHK